MSFCQAHGHTKSYTILAILTFLHSFICVEFGEENFSVKGPKDQNLLAKCVGFLCRIHRILKIMPVIYKSLTFRKRKPAKRFPSVSRTVDPTQSEDTWSSIHKRTYVNVTANHPPAVSSNNIQWSIRRGRWGTLATGCQILSPQRGTVS